MITADASVPCEGAAGGAGKGVVSRAECLCEFTVGTRFDGILTVKEETESAMFWRE